MCTYLDILGVFLLEILIKKIKIAVKGLLSDDVQCGQKYHVASKWISVNLQFMCSCYSSAAVCLFLQSQREDAITYISAELITGVSVLFFCYLYLSIITCVFACVFVSTCGAVLISCPVTQSHWSILSWIRINRKIWLRFSVLQTFVLFK